MRLLLLAPFPTRVQTAGRPIVKMWPMSSIFKACDAVHIACRLINNWFVVSAMSSRQEDPLLLSPQHKHNCNESQHIQVTHCLSSMCLVWDSTYLPIGRFWVDALRSKLVYNDLECKPTFSFMPHTRSLLCQQWISQHATCRHTGICFGKALQCIACQHVDLTVIIHDTTFSSSSETRMPSPSA